MTNTTTSSASDSGLNLDHLEALARAATPGPWTSTHWTCHAATTVMRSGSTFAIAETSGFGRDATECAADAEFIAAANPAAMLELIALARRAAPVSAPIAETDDAFIEQAVHDAKVYGVMPNSANTIGVGRAVLAAERKRAALANQPAPTAAPVHHWDSANLRKACDDAAKVLRETDWPLLANRLVSNVEAVLGNGSVAPTAAPEQVARAASVGAILRNIRDRVMNDQGVPVDLIDKALAALSQPSEAAPLDAQRKRLTEEEVRELAMSHLHDDTESATRNGFFTFSAEGLDGFAIDLMDRISAAAPSLPAAEPSPTVQALNGRITGSHACFSEAMPPGSLTSVGHAHVYKALQAAIAHYVAHQPAQEQAEPDAYMAVLGGREPISVHFQRVNAELKVKEWEGAGEVVPLYRATPSQTAQRDARIENGVQYIMDAIAHYAEHKDASTLSRLRTMIEDSERRAVSPVVRAQSEESEVKS
jgi:hypothetical protein